MAGQDSESSEKYVPLGERYRDDTAALKVISNSAQSISVDIALALLAKEMGRDFDIREVYLWVAKAMLISLVAKEKTLDDLLDQALEMTENLPVGQNDDRAKEIMTKIVMEVFGPAYKEVESEAR